MKQNYEDFDEFIVWLKNDGLKPFKSERIWKKKIFTNLLNCHVQTLENYTDFLVDKKLKSLKGKKTTYRNFNKVIFDVKVSHDFYILRLEDMSVLKIKTSDFDEFAKSYVNWEKDE